MLDAALVLSPCTLGGLNAASVTRLASAHKAQRQPLRVVCVRRRISAVH
jgi:hypothetical protein